MSCLPVPDAFGLGSSAADFATGVASQAATELPGFGAGVLAGTLPEGLNSIGSIVPELAGGALSGIASGVGDLVSGSGGGSGTAAADTALTGIGPLGTAGGSPVSGAITSPTQTALSTASGGPTGGPLGGAAASAAPVSAPVSPTTAGTFGDLPKEGTSLIGANATSPVTGATLSGTPLSSMPSTDPTAAASTPAAPGTAPTPQTSVDKFLADPGLKTGFGVLSNNANLILPAAGLVASALTGNQKLPQESALTTQAAELAAQGKTLQNYLNTGTLPPGMQAGLSGAGAAAKAAIRSRHASSGTSGSSAEQQELASVDSQMQTQGANMALQLFQAGLNETQISSQLYRALLANALQQDDQLAQAIGRFSSAAAGGGATIRVGT